MKNTAAIFLIFLIVSCTTQPEKPKEQVTIVKDSVLTQEDSVEQEFALEQKRLAEKQEEDRKEFRARMQEKSFSFTSYDQCDSVSSATVYKDKKKYGKRKPFDIKTTTSGDSIKVKFKFIMDCCMEYVSDVEMHHDTLKLFYRNISSAPCDCYCYYYYMYSLPKEKYNFKYIILGDSLIRKK